MSNVRWVKTYDLRLSDRHFKVFLSEHEGEGFYAGCLWYEKEGRMLKAPGQPGSISFSLKHVFGDTEQQAIDELMAWAKEKFDDEVKLSPRK